MPYLPSRNSFLASKAFFTLPLLVVDGPIFKKRIDISKTEKVLRDGYWFLDIQEYQLL
jgi:hypothetical protein